MLAKVCCLFRCWLESYFGDVFWFYIRFASGECFLFFFQYIIIEEECCGSKPDHFSQALGKTHFNPNTQHHWENMRTETETYITHA